MSIKLNKHIPLNSISWLQKEYTLSRGIITKMDFERAYEMIKQQNLIKN